MWFYVLVLINRTVLDRSPGLTSHSGRSQKAGETESTGTFILFDDVIKHSQTGYRPFIGTGEPVKVLFMAQPTF